MVGDVAVASTVSPPRIGAKSGLYSASSRPDEVTDLKGVVLCGGTGSRLLPLTKVTNKHLLRIGPRVMADYPIDKLISAGIREILIVTGVEHAGAIISYFGSGRDRDCEFTYRVQDRAGGIAEALGLARGFASGGKICVVLGDNLFEDSLEPFVSDFASQYGGARVLLKRVPDPERFGVAEIRIDGSEDSGSIVGIEEKPTTPKSDLAVVGVYFYSPDVFDIISDLHSSARGEKEITDVNAEYIRRGQLHYNILTGWWTDAGTFASLEKASELVRGSQGSRSPIGTEEGGRDRHDAL